MKEKLTAAACAFAAGVFAASMMPLDGEWTLDYFPQPGDGAVRSLPLKVPYTTVKATVPGNCELDLVNAGILPPMEMGLNVLKLRPYEGYQWLYTKSFEKPEVADGQRVMLRFGGIDTLADIFISSASMERGIFLSSMAIMTIREVRMPSPVVAYLPKITCPDCSPPRT